MIKLDIQQINRKAVESTIESGRAVFVIDIPDSETAPHQALDNRYYGRIASSSKPLGHQWIMDILGRRKFSDLEISFNYAFINPDDPNHCRIEGIQPVLIVNISNKGKVYANYVNCILFIRNQLVKFNNLGEKQRAKNIEANGEEFIRIIRENVITEQLSSNGEIIGRAPGRYVPILPNTTHSYLVPLTDRFNSFKFNIIKDLPLLKI